MADVGEGPPRLDAHVDVDPAAAGGLGEPPQAKLAEELPGLRRHALSLAEVRALLGVQVEPELVRVSVSDRRTGQGWNVIVPMWPHHATTASSVGQTSSAWRPEGNSIRAVSTYSGAPFGTRFW